jgi:hypothetical protein
MNVLAIDMDGTAMQWPDKVNALYENPSNFIVIYTARSPSFRKETEEQLHEKNIRYHALVMGKMRADVYVDDKNVGGLKWPE